MSDDDGTEVVRRYYRAYRAEGPAAVAEALAAVLGPGFVLESPLVEDRFDGPVSGAAAVAVAQQAAPALRRAEIEALYSTADGTGVVALIRFPTPNGVVAQSEHFDVDLRTGTIDRLRSYYDPRRLLASAPPTDG